METDQYSQWFKNISLHIMVQTLTLISSQTKIFTSLISLSENGPNPSMVDMVVIFPTQNRTNGSPKDLVDLHACGFFYKNFDDVITPSLIWMENQTVGLENLTPPIDDPIQNSLVVTANARTIIHRAFDVYLEKEPPELTDIRPDPILQSFEQKGPVVRAVLRRLQSISFFKTVWKEYNTFSELHKCVEDTRCYQHHFHLRRLCILLSRKCTELKIHALAAVSELRGLVVKLVKKAGTLKGEEDKWVVRDKFFDVFVGEVDKEIQALKSGLPCHSLLLDEGERMELRGGQYVFNYISEFLRKVLQPMQKQRITAQMNVIEVCYQ